MYSPLSLSGKRVPLKGFQGFLGGLDNEKGMTGELSVSTEYAGLEIMFHVAPLMPYDPNDPQQVSTIRTCTYIYVRCNGLDLDNITITHV